MQIKSFAILHILILGFIPAFTQFDSSSIAPIKDIIKAQQDTAIVYYVDSIIYHKSIAYLKEILKKRKYSWKYDGINKRTFVLTQKEKEQIIKELKSLKLKRWNKNLFANSVRVPADSFMRKAININSYHIRTLERKYKYVWQFGKPVFLRNGTIAFVQYIYICHSSCGVDEIAFYKKIDGQWKRWVRIESGVF